MFLNSDHRKDLLTDLTSQTGLNIEKVRIRKIDIVKGIAELEAYFRDKNVP
jgi:hypothetical protein